MKALDVVILAAVAVVGFFVAKKLGYLGGPQQQTAPTVTLNLPSPTSPPPSSSASQPSVEQTVVAGVFDLAARGIDAIASAAARANTSATANTP